jgi:hypothetical protein
MRNPLAKGLPFTTDEPVVWQPTTPTTISVQFYNAGTTNRRFIMRPTRTKDHVPFSVSCLR